MVVVRAKATRSEIGLCDISLQAHYTFFWRCAKLPRYSPLHPKALQFLKEYSDLCNALMCRAEELTACLERAIALRNSVTQLALTFRHAIKEFATRNVCDEKRLLKSVSGLLRWRGRLKGFAGQVLRRISKRAWQLEQIFGEMSFEADIVDERLLATLRIHRTIDSAVQLRNWMRAIARHYALLMGTLEAVRFLQDLTSELETLL